MAWLSSCCSWRMLVSGLFPRAQNSRLLCVACGNCLSHRRVESLYQAHMMTRTYLVSQWHGELTADGASPKSDKTIRLKQFERISLFSRGNRTIADWVQCILSTLPLGSLCRRGSCHVGCKARGEAWALSHGTLPQVLRTVLQTHPLRSLDTRFLGPSFQITQETVCKNGAWRVSQCSTEIIADKTTTITTKTTIWQQPPPTSKQN